LIGALERENRLLGERLETEKRAAAVLAELNETRRAENEALRSAVTAKSEVVAAKDEVIVGQERVIEALKRKKSSPWKRSWDVLIGIAAGVLIKR
jgi:hypothetical protein